MQKLCEYSFSRYYALGAEASLRSNVTYFLVISARHLLISFLKCVKYEFIYVSCCCHILGKIFDIHVTVLTFSVISASDLLRNVAKC